MINWRLYNNSLVRRGEVVLDLDVIDNWSDHELTHGSVQRFSCC
jgi:hypothetical protein